MLCSVRSSLRSGVCARAYRRAIHARDPLIPPPKTLILVSRGCCATVSQKPGVHFSPLTCLTSFLPGFSVIDVCCINTVPAHDAGRVLSPSTLQACEGLSLFFMLGENVSYLCVAEFILSLFLCKTAM